MGLRQRKHINYASEQVGGCTPAWLKKPAAVIQEDNRSDKACRSLTVDLVQPEPEQNKASSGKHAPRDEEANPVSLHERLAKRRPPLSDVNANVLAERSGSQHQGKDAAGGERKRRGTSEPVDRTAEAPPRGAANSAEPSTASRRKSAAAVEGHNHSSRGPAKVDHKRRGRPKSAPYPPPHASDGEHAAVPGVDGEEELQGGAGPPCAKKAPGSHTEGQQARSWGRPPDELPLPQQQAGGADAVLPASPTAAPERERRKGKSAPLPEPPSQEALAMPAEPAAAAAAAKSSKRKSAGPCMPDPCTGHVGLEQQQEPRPHKQRKLGQGAKGAKDMGGCSSGGSGAGGGSGVGRTGRVEVEGARAQAQGLAADHSNVGGSSGGFKTLEEVARGQQRQQQQQQARSRSSAGTSKGPSQVEELPAQGVGAQQPCAPAAPAAAAAARAGPSNDDLPLPAATAAAAAAAAPAKRNSCVGGGGNAEGAGQQQDEAEAVLLRPLSPRTLASGAHSHAFGMLQKQYARLQELYQQLKAQKISELEGLLEEQDEYVEAVNTSVHALAQHWREEAEHQVQLTEAAGSGKALDRMRALEEENLALKRTIVEHEVGAVQLRIQLAEQRQQLAAALARAEGAEAAEQQLRQALQEQQQAAAEGKREGAGGGGADRAPCPATPAAAAAQASPVLGSPGAGARAHVAEATTEAGGNGGSAPGVDRDEDVGVPAGRGSGAAVVRAAAGGAAGGGRVGRLPAGATADTSPLAFALPTPGSQPAGMRLGSQPAGMRSGSQPAGMPLGSQPAGMPLGSQPAGTPLGSQPAGTPLGSQPAGTPLGSQPAGTPSGRHERHTPQAMQLLPPPPPQQQCSVSMQFPTPAAPPAPSPGVACQFPTPAPPSSSSSLPSASAAETPAAARALSSSIVAHMPTPPPPAAEVEPPSLSTVEQLPEAAQHTHGSVDGGSVRCPETGRMGGEDGLPHSRSSADGSPVDGLCMVEGGQVEGSQASSDKKATKAKRASTAHTAAAARQQQEPVMLAFMTPRASEPQPGAPQASTPLPVQAATVAASPDVIDLNPMSSQKTPRPGAATTAVSPAAAARSPSAAPVDVVAVAEAAARASAARSPSRSAQTPVQGRSDGWGGASGWQPMSVVRLARLQDDMMMEQEEEQEQVAADVQCGAAPQLTSPRQREPADKEGMRAPLPSTVTCPPPSPASPKAAAAVAAAAGAAVAGACLPEGELLQQLEQQRKQQQEGAGSASADGLGAGQPLRPSSPRPGPLCPGMEQVRSAALATAAALQAATHARASADVNTTPASAAALGPSGHPVITKGVGLQVDPQAPPCQQCSPQLSVASPRAHPDGASVAGAQHRLLQGLAGEAHGSVNGDNFGGGQPTTLPPAAQTPARPPLWTPKTARMQAGVRSLFGFELQALPQEGAFEYTHHATGMRFQLWPATDDASDDSELHSCLVGGGSTSGANRLRLIEYRPLSLGAAKPPSYMRAAFQFAESHKQAFMNELWEALKRN